MRGNVGRIGITAPQKTIFASLATRWDVNNPVGPASYLAPTAIVNHAHQPLTAFKTSSISLSRSPDIVPAPLASRSMD